MFYSLLQYAGKNSLGMHRVLGVAGFAACIKFMKYWYEKQNINTILEREKLKAELQSLKAQIHPHFLFNTLNNIYAVTQNSSPEASDMIHRLSALLRYILYECNKPEIGLTQEFKIIGDYISLERIRYSENLDLHIQFPTNTDHLLIAPLLLVPLVENCFKHGTSRMLDQPWINIQAEVKGNILNVRLINSKPDLIPSEKNDSGIGLSNVKKRLELLYPGKFDLKILPEADSFVVALKLELHNRTELHSNEQAR
jgi:LytS/YehU family sensor histidine kinase